MEKYKDCLEYIEKYWDELICNIQKSNKTLIKLPNSFIPPNKKLFNQDQFYWDSFFIITGLLEANRIDLAKGMVDNLTFLFDKYGIIPSRNRHFNLGISQPPFLTSMAIMVYERNDDKKWLNKVLKRAEKELNGYWKDEHHLVDIGLSRYCDHHMNHITAEHESGWDMTSRFQDECMNYLPVDLNCCLYKYELDLGRTEEAERRRLLINHYMWDDSAGFYFDYDYVNKKTSDFHTLAGFFPMWAGVATREQAEMCRRKLRKFERAFGLVNTQKNNLKKPYRQWDYPNGWAPLHLIVVEGLIKYGYIDDAMRIARKWLNTVNEVFVNTGKIWEKYDVLKKAPGKDGRYITQSGFGWTNAVFLKLVRII